MTTDARSELPHRVPLGAKKQRCRKCTAFIFFALTPKGKPCPFDSIPAPDGEYVVLAEGMTGPKIVFAVQMEKIPETGWADRDEPRYHSHFKTCTHPQDFSKHGRH